MSRPLASDIRWLRERLAEVEGVEGRAAVERVRAIATRMLAGSGLDPELATLGLDEMQQALKLLAIGFHLRNKAEQVHIVRVNRRREREATAASPRAESIDDAMAVLRDRGESVEDVLALLGRLDVRPTLTAHPTESRRRSVIEKQARIGALLRARDAPQSLPAEVDRCAEATRAELALLLGTDEVRARRLDVIDEVRNGVIRLSGAIWDAVPVLARDVGRAIEARFGRPTPLAELPPFLRYRTWIGGDRDGNPNVTAITTRAAIVEMRAAALRRHRAAIARLERSLSLSAARVPIDPALVASIERDEAERPLDAERVRHLAREPFRVKLRHVLMRLGGGRREDTISASGADGDYTASRFLEDLETIDRALRFAGLDAVADAGPLADAIVHARVFGFHLAAIDVRQHSRVHEIAVAELLRAGGTAADYVELDEAARTVLLSEELRSSRPLLARDADVSPTTRELLDTLGVLAELARREPEAVGSYVVSMAHAPSDVLEVLVLLREAGLWTIDGGVVRSAIDVAPLFETVDDLAGADDVVRELFEVPAYRAHLAARGNLQEIMLGYSDSNKDGGAWTANWRLQCAQASLARACRDSGVDFRFFHGRGGTVARGGGRANRAILAAPASSRNGRIRFTEQGEVISFRYAMPELARRHLEQIVNAMLVGTSLADAGARTGAESDRTQPTIEDDPTFRSMMDDLADRSRSAYRALVDDPTFWPSFSARSPVEHIGALPIASRPVSRGGGELAFDGLRAIPWVFSWTQMRATVPGWFGVGTAFASCVLDDPDRLALAREAYASGGCFRTFLDNVQQEMARARLEVFRWYLGADDERLRVAVTEEFARAERAVLAITGQSALLDNNPVIQRSIDERNPDTDAINAVQVELLRRWRALDPGDEERATVHALLMLSVNGLAAAMQSTG